MLETGAVLLFGPAKAPQFFLRLEG